MVNLVADSKDSGMESDQKVDDPKRKQVKSKSELVVNTETKRKKGNSTVKLDRVLGLTVNSNAALACDPNSGLVAYPAGCTLVLFNPRKNKQSHIINGCRKTITAVAFSPDGKFLATGECGHQPALRIWDVAEKIQVAEFLGHKYGVNCVAFSPNHRYVVSVGTQHDMIVNVWDWKAGTKVASNKVSSKVKSVSFAENGSYFVTVGNRHVKFWYLEYSRNAKYKEPVPIMGRSAILGEQRNNDFCDVACGRGETADSTFVITKAGLLCEFNNRRVLDKWVELRTSMANSISVGENLIFIGCADGIVRCFNPHTLRFVTTLPRTHYLGVDVSVGLNISHMASLPPGAMYPDTIAVAYDETNYKVTAVYNDHSLYVWDVTDIQKVGKSHSFLFHSSCIWGVDVASGDAKHGVLPPLSFITCSNDDTVRIWNLEPCAINNGVYRRNIYSTELLKTVYFDSSYSSLRDIVEPPNGETSTPLDGKNGVRCIRISPDGRHLASGDRSGNIRIHDLKTLEKVVTIEAHDAEVLCLEYSRPESGHKFLVSASRDRLIHVFNVDQKHQFVQTLDDHSSSITAVRFLFYGGQLQLVSCGADKSIIFRELQENGSSYQFSRSHNVNAKGTLYDMEADQTNKHVLAACQDRNIRVYNSGSGKHSKTFRGSLAEDGTLIKLSMDSSGMYIATSCTDRTLCIYDYLSGECVATMSGHSELVTGLRFTPDGKHLITASGDGCIFFWKLPHDMTVTVQARRQQQVARDARRQTYTTSRVISHEEEFGSPPPDLLDPSATLASPNVEEPEYRLSMGPLPLWAKRQVDTKGVSRSSSSCAIEPPKGRWAQRIDPNSAGMSVRSVFQGDSIIPFPSSQGGTQSGESDGSKDSSLENNWRTNAGRLRRGYGDLSSTESGRGRTLTDDSSVGSLKIEDLEGTEHDGDIDDDSDAEGAQMTRELLYYPHADDTSSDYTVNAMDVEELRRSSRRFKKPRGEPPSRPASVAISLTGSQDSDEDEGDDLGAMSTTSGEAVDKNLNTLAASMDAIDLVGKREKYLRNEFETLENPVDSTPAKTPVDPSCDSYKNSLSSRFLSRESPAVANAPLISSTLAQQRDPTAAKNREELLRRLEESKKKLQSIGSKSGIKSSQSINDLSRLSDMSSSSNKNSPSQASYASPANRPDGDEYYGYGYRLQTSETLPNFHLAKRITLNGGILPSKMGNNFIEPEKKVEDRSQHVSDAEESGLRRAISLSDLTRSSSATRRILPSPPVNVSGRNLNKPSQASTPTRLSNRLSGSSNLNRSASVGILNQTSDSEGDTSPEPPARISRPASAAPASSGSSVMRPTLSSLNKVVNTTKQPIYPPKPPPRRISNAISTGDLRQNAYDSSDDEKSTSVRAKVLSFERSASKTQRESTRLDLSKHGRTSMGNRAVSERDLSGRSGPSATVTGANVTVTKTKQETFTKKTTTTTKKTLFANPKPSDGTADVSNGKVTKHVCDSVIESWQTASENLLELHTRLATVDKDLLQHVITQVQPTLQGLVKSLSVGDVPSNPLNFGPEGFANPAMLVNMKNQLEMIYSIVQKQTEPSTDKR
ncbi:mitogen-activated protein kinase-binding protein 1-like isoform X4 [Artemia franciscana]|uniref:mitogen-activated protein kinase-binding protein 1-like isoform X4 n=1 Tax=Artemia franciscana TaxID=6661 RepID=UPI0032DA74AD